MPLVRRSTATMILSKTCTTSPTRSPVAIAVLLVPREEGSDWTHSSAEDWPDDAWRALQWRLAAGARAGDNGPEPAPESPMKPTIAKELNHRLPSEPRPDRRRPASPPWSLDLLAYEGRIRHHALSPDGTRLAFLWDRDAQSDMWLLDVEGSRWPGRLTHHP